MITILLTSHFLIINSQATTDMKYEEHQSALSYLTMNDGKIAYIDQGAGPVILFVHGIPSSSWMYRKLIGPLIEAGFRVIIPDMLGFGSSDKPDESSLYHCVSHAKRILQLMDHLKIKKWSHVVHDAGGLWTWELMLMEPHRVENLIILNTILFSEGFNPPVNMKRESLIARWMSNVYENRLIGKIIINATLKNGTRKYDFTKNEKRAYWLPIRSGSSTALRHFFTDFDYLDSLLPRIQTHLSMNRLPIYVIWGKHDKILDAEKQVPLIKDQFMVADHQIKILENAAHFITEEEPDLIISYILAFLQK